MSLITLEYVETFLAKRERALYFPPELEQRYEAHTRIRRSLRLRGNTQAMIIVYNLLLAGDWLLAPDRFRFATMLHFGLITPWMIFVANLMRRNPPKTFREGAAATLPLLIVFQVLAVFMTSTAPTAAHYQYFVLLAVMFANTIQRLPFRHALFVSTTISVAYVAAIAGSDHMPGPAAFVAVAMLAACAYTTLASNYYHERDARRNFLLTLREKFRHAQADAASKIDALTGLGNRRRLGDQLQQLWRSDRDEDSSVAVVMVDVDHFKSFNDTYGHPAGDSCLKRIASCIVAELRNENDLAFRYGGEELVIVLPDTDIIGATHLAERLRRAIEGLAIPNENAGTRKFVTASLGVAASAPSVLSSDELIAAADVALYAAKRNGRNRVCPPLAGATPQQGENVIPIARAS